MKRVYETHRFTKEEIETIQRSFNQVVEENKNLAPKYQTPLTKLARQLNSMFGINKSLRVYQRIWQQAPDMPEMYREAV